MSGGIVVSETPNWLNDLEAKREQRLKARLGHEAGAGAPCLKCLDKCPGLDLHFWRKACKICRCPKEEHDVPDDDLYGWTHFQLLGSRPNKIKTKIVLHGKNDEVELDWAPKGQKDTIDKYLNSLPPECLPVKGSQAAQERKQLLQKQIPAHDVDPLLCHELDDEEVKKMEEYIAHIKNSSVGVGQIVNLSSVIKCNLHNISPQEAQIIASRYSKGMPVSELVKLQANLELSPHKPKPLPSMQANKNFDVIENQQASHHPSNQFKDKIYSWHTSSGPGTSSQPQYSKNLETGFENPYFARAESVNPKAPKSVKDLMYSTYDPAGGPIPEDHNMQKFNPDAPKSMKKGLRKFEPVSGRLIEEERHPDIPRTTGTPMQLRDDFGNIVAVLNPDTGNYEDPTTEQILLPAVVDQLVEGRYPELRDDFGRILAIYNRNTGNYEDPETRQLVLPAGGKFDKLQRFDPVGGKPVEEQRYPEFRDKFGKLLAKYNPRTDTYEDPITQKRISPQDILKSATGKLDGSELVDTMGKVVIEELGYPELVDLFGRVLAAYNPSTGNYEDSKTRKPVPLRSLPGTELNDKFGNVLAVRDPSGSFVDPKTGKPILPQEIGKVTGKVIEELGYPQLVDPFGRVIAAYNSITGNYEDPITGKPVSMRSLPGIELNDKFGNILAVRDPSGSFVDPQTGKPISPQGNYEDSRTRKPVSLRSSPGTELHDNFGNVLTVRDPSGFGDPQTGQPILPQETAHVTGKVFEKLGYPELVDTFGRVLAAYNPSNGNYEDSKTGQPVLLRSLPGTELNDKFGNILAVRDPSGSFVDPQTGKQISPQETGQVTGKVFEELGYPELVNQFGRVLAAYNPSTGDYEDSKTRNPVSLRSLPGTELNDKFGNILAVRDPYGCFVDPKTGKPISPLQTGNIEELGYPDLVDPYDVSATHNPRTTGKSISPQGRKPLSEYHPASGHQVTEEYLHPHHVNIGTIHDIDVNPEIREAMTHHNPAFQGQEDYSPDSIKEILNNIKLPDCHRCKRPFEESEFAVSIDRANVLFHADCFKCSGCNQSLADNIYFYHKESDNVYCGRDYAKVRGIPRCDACDELLFTKEYCLAENATFHLKHFCCFRCDTPLAGQEYTLEEDKPYCLPCFEESKAAKCGTCERVIKTEEVGCNLNGVHFHADDKCFRCYVCSVPLMGKKLLLKSEKLFCSHNCFDEFKNK